MRKTQQKSRHLLVIATAVLVMALSACGPSKPAATPTMSVQQIYTAAFHTLTAQQATQLALTPPTATASQTPPPTIAPTTPPSAGTASTSGGGVQPCDNSVFVSDVTIPDGTVMTPGQTFTKTWTIMNNGTCPWTTSYKLVFTIGERMGGTSVPIPAAIPAGQQTQISVSLTAPTTPGDYTGWWRLQNDKAQYFGVSVSVVIKVSGGGSGATNTPGTPAATQPAATATTGTP